VDKALFKNIGGGISITSLAATVRALAGTSSPRPPGCRKEDSSYKYGPFRDQQTCTLQ
jgi:hypothetical protein